MAWNHNPNPPTGPGIGGPANGPGKGPGSGPAAPFTADSPTRVGEAHMENGDVSEQAYRAKRRADRRTRQQVREERTLDLEDRLYEVAMGLVPTATAMEVQAGRVLHSMWNGLPVATNVNLTADDVANLSDDDLRSELAKASGTATSDPPGDAPPGLPE